MTVVINGSTGITNVNGSASAPAETGVDTDTGIYYGTNTVGLATNGTSALFVDANQYVGIGTSSPLSVNTKLTVATGVTAQDGTTPALQLYNTGAGTDQKYLRIVSTTSGTFNFEKVNDAYSSATVLFGATSAGLFQFNSGYGSVATAYGCRAWVNFNGTTASPSTIRGSGNVTSVTKNGTGDYTVNFTTAMPDANYATTGLSSNKSGVESLGLMAIDWTSVPSTTAVRINTVARGTGNNNDNTYNNVAIFR